MNDTNRPSLTATEREEGTQVSGHLLLHDGETWFVHLGEKFDHEKAETVTADGRDMTPCDDLAEYRYVRWYAVDGERPRLVVVRWRERTVTTHYVLKSREAAEAIGESGRPDQVDVNDRDWDDELFYRLYDAVKVTERDDDTVIDLADAPVVEGTPPPRDGPKWVPDLPYALKHRPEYGHLFPGKLIGFRDALAEALTAEFGNGGGFGSGDGVRYRRSGESISVVLRIPFDPPLREPKRLKSGRKSTRETVEKYERREWEFSPSDTVRGDDRASAVAEWDRMIGEFIADVRGTRAKPCGHCAGTGVARAS